MEHKPPTSLFKFLHSEDLPFVLRDKTLRIGSSNLYRDQYHAMEARNEFINDPDEGRVFWVQTADFELGNASAPEKVAAHTIAESLGIASPSEGDIFIGNSIIHMLPNFHMLCFTHGHPSITRTVFCRSYPELRSHMTRALSLPTLLISQPHWRRSVLQREGPGSGTSRSAPYFQTLS